MSTLYTMREVEPNLFEVTAFEEDSTEPSSTYRTGIGTKKFCTCPGARGVKPCRHQQMIIDLVEAGVDLVGLFYERDTDQIYRPIPLQEEGIPFKIPTGRLPE